MAAVTFQFLMSNFDDFNYEQISSKLVQRYCFGFAFHCKNRFTLGRQDDSKDTKRNHICNYPIHDFASLQGTRLQERTIKR